MEVEIGASTNTNTTMFPSLFGLDEYLWPVGQEQNKNNQNESNHGLSKMDAEVHSQEFNTGFEDSNSLFDNEWMTTKFDFSSVLDGPFDTASNQETSDLISETSDVDILETVIQSSSNTISLHSNITSPESVCTTDESMLEEDCPASPDQHVPNAETKLENLDVKDWIDLIIIASGKPSAVDQNESGFSLNLDTVKTDQFYPIDKTPTQGKVMTHPEKASFKIKRKTPEQKQRKKLQNRNAATRYRYKKRSEQDLLNSQCTELENENKELQKKITSLQQETQYLKNLIIDVFQKKADQKK